MRETAIGAVLGLIAGVLLAVLIHAVQPPCNKHNPSATGGTCRTPHPTFVPLLITSGAISAGIGACCGMAAHSELLARRRITA